MRASVASAAMEVEVASSAHTPLQAPKVYLPWYTYRGILTAAYLRRPTHQIVSHVARRHTGEVAHGQHAVTQVLGGREGKRARLCRRW